MIQATDNSWLDNPRLSETFLRLGNVISRQNEHRAYGSLPETISSYAEKLSTELTYNPSRSRYLDLHIRRNELAEANMPAATSAEEKIESSSFKLFQDLFSYLDNLVQIRKDMLPTKGKKPPGTNRLLLDEKRPEFDKAISSLASAIGVFLESLSNQSKEFVEQYTRVHAKSVHQFMSAPLPKSQIKFRHLFGLDKNQDGSKRERIRKTPNTHIKKAPLKEPEILAEPYEGDIYKITLKRFNITVLAEIKGRIYPDGSARFRPLDDNLRLSMSKLNKGQDQIVAFLKK